MEITNQAAKARLYCLTERLGWPFLFWGRGRLIPWERMRRRLQPPEEMTRKAFWKDYEEDANRRTRDEGANYKFVFDGRTRLGAFGYRPRNEPEDGES